ncbi:hypothetical protein HDV00_007620 [Rhizophlyctis rosea]|nr:hypothetical protein HDV00_007620 [Rhizophlyctis rosea]
MAILLPACETPATLPAATTVTHPQPQSMYDYSSAKNEALIIAAEHGHLDIVNILLEASADVHHNNNQALRRAAMNSQEQIVEILLAAGATWNRLY